MTQVSHAVFRRATRLLTFIAPALVTASASLAAPTATTQGGQRVTASDLTALVDLDALSVSPDGKLAAFLTRQADPARNAHVMVWHVVPTIGGPSRRVADAGDPILYVGMGRVTGAIKSAAPVWSPDGRWIAFLRKTDGRIHAWRVRAAGGTAEQLTRGPRDASMLKFSSDGRRLFVQTQPSATQVAADLAHEGLRGFRYDTRFYPAYRTTPVLPADATLVRNDRRRTTDTEEAARGLSVVDLSTRRERAATPDDAQEFAALTSASLAQPGRSYREFFARAPSRVSAWTEARDPEKQGLLAPLTVVAERRDGETVVCAVAECTSQRIKGLWWRSNDEVLFARGEAVLNRDTALYAWRVGSDRVRLVLRTENLFTSSFWWDCSVAQDRLICFMEEPTRPRRLVAIDLDTGAVETLFEPNPAFGKLDLGPAPRRLEFRSASGKPNYGYLVLPPGAPSAQRLPLVIVTYRCTGFLRGGTGDEYPIFAFAAAGHAVLCFNVPDTDYVRGATMDSASYQNWMRGVNNPERTMVQEGLEAAIAELVRQGIADPDRVGVTGLSAGAEATAYALWRMPRLGAAIATGLGYEPASTFLSGPAAKEVFRAWGLDDPNSPRWRDLSLAQNATKVRAPLLINVADHEMINRLEPYTALVDAGRAVEMYVFPDEYHVKWQPAHRAAVYERNIDWMNYWLRGVEDASPTKAEQYKHWRAMRVKQCQLFTGDDAPWYCRPNAPPRR